MKLILCSFQFVPFELSRWRRSRGNVAFSGIKKSRFHLSRRGFQLQTSVQGDVMLTEHQIFALPPESRDNPDAVRSMAAADIGCYPTVATGTAASLIGQSNSN